MALTSIRIASGFAWLWTSSTACQVVTFLITIGVARLLGPTEFGTIMIALSVCNVFVAFSELGLSVALVQRKEISAGLVDSAVAITAIFAGGLASTLILSSTILSQFYGSESLKLLLQLLSISLIFRALASIGRCLLLRRQRYRALSMVNLGSEMIYGVVTLTLINVGLGSTAVGVAHLVGGAVLMVSMYAAAGYVPRSMGNIRDAISILPFGLWVSVGRALGDAAGRFDAFLIGKVMNLASAGFYTLAQRVATIVPDSITSALNQALLPEYSRLQDNHAELERRYWLSVRAVSYCALFPVAIFAAYARPIVTNILGEQWVPTIALIQIISIVGAAQALGGGVFNAIVIARGNPDVLAAINGVRLIVLPLCILLGAKFGLLGVAWGFAAYGIIGRMFNQWVLRIKYGFSLHTYFSLIRKPLIINSCFLVVGVSMVEVAGQLSKATELAMLAMVGMSWLYLYWKVASAACPEIAHIVRTLIPGSRF